MQVESRKIGTQYRHFQLDREAINTESRTVPLAFSSETPYERWFGVEILDHSPQSIRLGRLNDGGPLLLDHDPEEHIGVVERVEVSADRIGRAVVRFGRGPDAEAAFQDVIDGIRRHVSVGYIVHRMLMTEEKDGQETYRVTDWEPLEISLVAIPADPTVGVGRAAGAVEVETQVERPDPVEPQQRNADPQTPTEIQVMDDAREQGRVAEQKRTADLLALADQYQQYGARELVGDFIRNGKSVEQFKDVLMDKISTRHTDANDLHIGMEQGEVKRYSMVRAINAALTGDWSKAGLERAASEAVAKRTGMTAEGFFVPIEVMNRSFTVGTSTEAGNLVQTSVLGSEFIDVLRNALVLSKLGIRVLGGLTSNIAIPRKTSATPIASYSEIAAITAGNPNTAQITLAPKRIGGQVPYSKQALIQGSVDVEAMLLQDLADSVAVQIENLAINGTGASNQPRGVLNGVGIGSVVGGTNGAQITWAHIVGLESACANANSEPDKRAGYLLNTKGRGWLKVQQKAANLPFIWDNGETPINSYRAAVSNNVPSNGTKGTSSGICSSLVFGSDWSDLVLGLFGGLDVVVDPYTQAGTGQVVITANQFIDVAIRQAASFAAMTDALTS